MSTDTRMTVARNDKGSGKGLVPQHARKWPLWSEEWYKACDAAFVEAMWKKMQMLPTDPRAKHESRRVDACGEYVE